MEGQRVTTVASVGQNDVNPEQMAASHQGYDVFLCHAGENKAFVRQLVDRLEKDGLKKERIFYDEISLQPGDKLDSILKVIESPSLKLFVFVVSKYCFKSNKAWIRTEWETALENNKQIFPIWLDENDDGFKAFGNLVKDFSYKLKTIIAQRVNPQEISRSLDGLSEKICSLVFGDQQTQQRPQPPSNVGPSSARQNFLPDVLPAKLKLEFVQKSLSKLLDKAEALFDDDTLKNEDRLEEADKIFDRFKARIVSIIPQGCFIFNLRFFQPDNVDEFYHDHFRLGPASLSAALTSLLVTDQMRAAAGGEELMVRVEVRYDDYIRVRRQLCMTGILKTSSVDDLTTLVRPRTERRLMRADLEGMDLAIVISEDSRFTEWVSHPGTRHLAKKARQKSSQVTVLERRLEIGKHQGEIQEDILRSLQREVTRLKTQDEEAQKVLMTKTEEVNELQKTNKDLEAKIEAIMVAKPKIPIISPDEDDASRGARDEEAQRALMRKTQEINHLHETIRGLEATIKAMEAAKTDTPGPGKDDTPRGAEGGAPIEEVPNDEKKENVQPGILKTTSVDNLSTLVPVRPRTDTSLKCTGLEGLDMAIAITEDARFTEWVSHPGTLHLANKVRQVTVLERRLQHQAEIQESLQGEVTRLTEKNEDAQKAYEVSQKAYEEAKKYSEEARKALMRKTEEINELQKTIRGLEATIEAMEAAKTKMDTPSPGKEDTPRGAEDGAPIEEVPTDEKKENVQPADGPRGAESGARPKEMSPQHQQQLPQKRERKIIKITDNTGRDVTEEILGGGSGRSTSHSAMDQAPKPIRILQRYSAPPTVTSTPPQTFAVPQQAYPQAPTWAHIVAGRTPTQGEQHVYRPSEGPQWDPGVRGTDPASHEALERAKRIYEQDRRGSTESYLGDLVPWIPEPEPLPMDWIQGELERLLTEEWEDNHSIFEWIEENVSKGKTKHVTFIRALMTAVARSAIVDEGTGQELCDTDSVQKRVVLLQMYLDNESTKELQALFALQALMVELDHPPNLLETFFDVLYDENVISKYAFYAWESNTDPAEQEGKRVALKSVTAFFTRLREEEERR